MEKIVRIDTVTEFNAVGNYETLHPLVSIIDLSKSTVKPPPENIAGVSFGFYTVLLKEVKCGDMRYGKNTYDYQEGTLVFIAPGQVIGADNSAGQIQPKGYALVFHPDLIHGTHLGKQYRITLSLAISPMKRCIHRSGKRRLYWIVF